MRAKVRQKAKMGEVIKEMAQNQARLALFPELVKALGEMIEHFATLPDKRTAASYGRSNRDVAASAWAVLARAQEIEKEAKG